MARIIDGDILANAFEGIGDTAYATMIRRLPTLDPIAHLEAELNNAESEARFYGLEWKDGYKYALKVLKDYLGVK